MTKNCWDYTFDSKMLEILSSWNENRVKIKISTKKKKILLQRSQGRNLYEKRWWKNYQRHYKTIERYSQKRKKNSRIVRDKDDNKNKWKKSRETEILRENGKIKKNQLAVNTWWDCEL